LYSYSYWHNTQEMDSSIALTQTAPAAHAKFLHGVQYPSFSRLFDSISSRIA
jgi:hypothetical protein